MINEKALTGSIALADHYADSGLTVQAAPNTIMSEMVRLTNEGWGAYSIGQDLVGMEKLGELCHGIARGTNGHEGEKSQHDLYVDSVVPELSAAVISHIGFARNVAKPMVLTFADRVREALAKNPVRDVSTAFNIEMLDVPEVLGDESFVDLLRHYKDMPAVVPTRSLELEDVPSEELIAMLSIGEQALDQALTTWAQAKGPEFFKNVWGVYFGNALCNKGYDRSAILAFSIFDMADTALAIYLFASKLYSDVNVQSSKYSLDAYRALAAETRDLGGVLLKQALTRAEALYASRTVIVEPNRAKANCRVVGRIYRDWLKHGGSPEVIFGVLVSDLSAYTEASLTEFKEKALSSWSSYSTYYNTAQANQNFNRTKDLLAVEFDAVMQDLTEAEKGMTVTNPSFLSNIKKYFLAELEEMRTGDLADLNAVAQRLICRARYYYTDADKILSAIDDAGKLYPTIDVREAALMAEIEYVVDYVADQLSLTKDC